MIAPDASGAVSANAMTSQNSVGPSPIALKLIDLTATLLRYAVPWAAVCLALYLFLQIVRAAAGTGSDAIVALLSNVTRTRALAFVFGVMGALYGIEQRNLRRTATQRLKARIDTLERELAAVRPPAGS